MLFNKKYEQRETSADFGYGFTTVQNPVWTVAQIRQATGGRLLNGHDEVRLRSIATDSRLIEPGDLFLALRGDSFDGHDFLQQAVQRGVSALMVDREPDFNPLITVVLVADTLKALGDLAAFRRAQMSNLLVVAITGSSGKTTVKEMTAAIFAQKARVLKTKGNFNNLVGLPLSLLPVDYRHQVAVLEMGMNRPGEIARLTEIADPDLGCIVNVQAAHLEGLGSIEGVARAKGELFIGMKAAAKLVVNLDDPLVRRLAARSPNQRITFGRHRQAMVRATRVRNNGELGMSFTLQVGTEKIRVHTRALGVHNVMNALAASALAVGGGLGLEDIARGLAAFAAHDKRLQVEQLPCGLKLVNDTYNANPSSMRAALEALQGLRRESHKSVAILGDMLELGAQSLAAHQSIGEAVANLGFDYLLTVGNFSGEVAGAARRAGMAGERVKACADKDELVAWLADRIGLGELGPGDWLLLKGSRGMRMETIIAPLKMIGAGE